LDVTIQAQVLDLIRQLQKKKDMALLLITHDMGVVAEMADDVIVMYASENVEHGNVLDIFDNAAHPYTQGLFSSLAGFTDPTTPLKPILGTVPSPMNYPAGCKFNPRCPFAMEKCRKGSIPFFSMDKTDNHEARCLLYDGSEESLLRIKGK
jgi:oligopeptide/dipeptide ABC transporter ATP-binding protein